MDLKDRIDAKSFPWTMKIIETFVLHAPHLATEGPPAVLKLLNDEILQQLFEVLSVGALLKIHHA